MFYVQVFFGENLTPFMLCEEGLSDQVYNLEEETKVSSNLEEVYCVFCPFSEEELPVGQSIYSHSSAKERGGIAHQVHREATRHTDPTGLCSLG